MLGAVRGSIVGSGKLLVWRKKRMHRIKVEGAILIRRIRSAIVPD